MIEAPNAAADNQTQSRHGQRAQRMLAVPHGGVPVGNNSISKESIEACSEKMLLEIRVAASNNQAMALNPYT
jgi:hypothetical protein